MNRHSEFGDHPDEFDEVGGLGDPDRIFAPEEFEDQGGAISLIDQLLVLAPDRDPSRPLLYRLRRELLEQQITFQEARRTLVELEAALEKVTAPASRVGIFLGSASPGTANIMVGGSEYLANVDPRVDIAQLTVGTRVLVNEAYAVVGRLEYGRAGAVVRITDLLDRGRLRVGREPGTQDLIVERSAELEEVELKVGDEVRVDPGFRVAVERLQPREGAQHFLEEIQPMPWSRIGGQAPAIKAIRDTIELPALHPELFDRFQYSAPKGFLLHGPPGCGKTLIGKATAYNLVQHLQEREGLVLKEHFMHVKGPEMLNMWLGETERMVRELFTQAREKRREGYLPFVFIDEAESILGTRRSMRSHHISNTVVPMFCTEMDGIESLQDVVIILASNRHDLIDPALLRPGRIDRKIKVARPDSQASRDILRIYLTPDLPFDPAELERCGGPEPTREALVEETIRSLFARVDDTRFLEVGLRSGRQETLYYGDLVSGAIIASIVQRAKESAIKRAIDDADPAAGIGVRDLHDACLAEFRENEIFPPTDSVEEWLKLLDYDPENVVRVAPIRRREKDTQALPGSVV